MASRGRGGRRKGAEYERRIAKLLKAVWPEARRGIGQTRNAGEVCDVEGTPWWIECKHRDAASPRAAYQQGLEATDGRPVVVIWKRTGMRSDLVTVRLHDLVEPYVVPDTAAALLVTIELADWLSWAGLRSWGVQ